MPILLAKTIEYVHVEQVYALLTFCLGQDLLYKLNHKKRNTSVSETTSHCYHANASIVES
jgi:hypothetical protein